MNLLFAFDMTKIRRYFTAWKYFRFFLGISLRQAAAFATDSLDTFQMCRKRLFFNTKRDRDFKKEVIVYG